MKIYNILFAVILLFSSCNLDNRTPEFKKIQNVKLEKFTSSNIIITADAVVFNPNGISVYLQKTEVDIYANDIKVSHVSQTQNIEITKNSDFIIPLQAKFKPKDLVKKDGSIINILSSALNSLKNKNIDLKYVGTATFKVAKVEFNVPINYEESIVLKK